MGVPKKVKSRRKGLLDLMEYTIADATESTRLAVWEENVGVLKEEQSYHLSGVMVAMYEQQKHLSLSMNATYEEIADIGDVTGVDALPAEPERSSFTNVKTVVGMVNAIEHVEVYSGCNPMQIKATSQDMRCGAMPEMWQDYALV